MSVFRDLEKKRQTAFFRHSVPPDALRNGAGYVLDPKQRHLNLAPEVREPIAAYFGPPRNIQWHRYAYSGVSSQICCVNFLMPLASRPELLEKVIGRALGHKDIRMLPTENGPSYVGFEWIGAADYLDEWPSSGVATRGAKVTSADAVVRFEHEGRSETLLIEWKYTESYGDPPDSKGHAKRVDRYANKTFAPNGPIRADLGLKVEDLFWEPFYQLTRQQMLAWHMQRAREDGAERVSVLHVSPAGNRALHRVTALALRHLGDDAFEVFRQILVQPQDFISISVEDMFGGLLEEYRHEAWATYLSERYGCARDNSRDL